MQICEPNGTRKGTCTNLASPTPEATSSENICVPEQALRQRVGCCPAVQTTSNVPTSLPKLFRCTAVMAVLQQCVRRRRLQMYGPHGLVAAVSQSSAGRSRSTSLPDCQNQQALGKVTCDVEDRWSRTGGAMWSSRTLSRDFSSLPEGSNVVPFWVS